MAGLSGKLRVVRRKATARGGNSPPLDADGWPGSPTAYAVQWLDTGLPVIRGEAVDDAPASAARVGLVP